MSGCLLLYLLVIRLLFLWFSCANVLSPSREKETEKVAHVSYQFTVYNVTVYTEVFLFENAYFLCVFPSKTEMFIDKNGGFPIETLSKVETIENVLAWTEKKGLPETADVTTKYYAVAGSIGGQGLLRR